MSILLNTNTVLKAQGCSAQGNVIVYSNYDGGYLNINVNENIPNLKIGVASYEPTQVNIFGAFAGNVTEVVYAGIDPINGTGNNNCSGGPLVGSVAVSAPNVVVNILNIPPVTLLATQVDTISSIVPDLVGNNTGIFGCYSCSLTKGTGGANNSAQVIDFFAKYFNSDVRFLKTQYFCWCDTLDVKSPPNCCLDLVRPADIQVESGTSTICPGDTLTLRAEPSSSFYAWSTGVFGVDSILVTAPGVYAVTISDECGTSVGTVALTDCPNEICDNLLDDDGDGLVDLDDRDCPCNNSIPPLTLSVSGPENQVPIGEAFQLNALVNRPLSLVQLIWTPATGLDCANCPDVEGVLFENTTFVLAATDTFGCNAETTFEVLVDKTRRVYAPNVFSPEIDGENNVFKLFPGKGIEAVRRMRVYDRWGALVYEGISGWDGFTQGEQALPGVYVWFAELQYFGGGTGLLEGHVTLIR